MLIYLDNCCFNRPYDDQEHVNVFLETQAKLYIQESILAGRFKLVWSYTSPGHDCGFLAADFMPIAALLKQFHSLLCACFSALLSTKINSLSFPQP